jgi:hypothetical protein
MKSSKHVKSNRTMSVEEQDLDDRDEEVFDTALYFDLFEIHQLATEHFRDLHDFYHAWEYDLAKFIVPQTYNFPEFVSWCSSNYVPLKRSLISKNGLVLFVLNAQSIFEMLKLVETLESQILNEENLASSFKELNPQEKNALLQSYLDKDTNVPENASTYDTNIFPEISRQVIVMMCTILGYDNDKIVDESILGFMYSIFPPSLKPLIKFNYAQYLVDTLHFQLLEFGVSRCCRFQSYLVYLFLYFQAIKFQHLELKIEDGMGNPCIVIHWTTLVRKKPQNAGFSEFINQFMSTTYTIIHEEVPPRIFPECKKLL